MTEVRMTRSALEEYRSLIREARAEDIRLRRLASEAERFREAEARREAEEYRREIEKNLVRCTLICGAVQKFINGIENSRLRRIFTMYYIYGWSWNKIAYIMNYSKERIYQIHRQTLKQLFSEIPPAASSRF